MPDMTGAELAREIRRLRPDVPILLITGYAGRALEERDLAAFPVLHKPFTPKQLEAAVRAILERTAT
jgi:two-component SAPR family response regulator